jgi:tetratricopeptide (TPR) repeat protein
MGNILISFKDQNVGLGGGRWLFKRSQTMRFEWLALLGFKRLTAPGDQAWVTLQEIARLPSWKGRKASHIGTNVGRYLQSPELSATRLVSEQTKWAGPYRLAPDALAVEFDLPLAEVRQRLRLDLRPPSATERLAMIRYTGLYVRARWLGFKGFLNRGSTGSTGDTAYEKLMRMADDRSYGSTLRLLACLSAVEVQYRLGQIRAARRTLVDNAYLVRGTPDASLKARYYLELAWAHQRSSTGKLSDRRVGAALGKANFYAENCGDRASLGQLAFRRSGYLTKRRRLLEAVSELVHALEAFLITANYDYVQATCGNLGSVLHRIGPTSYSEARRWLLLGITIARLMNMGRDDAHGEMILAKIYLESGKKAKSERLLQRAQRIADRAGNRINLADVHMVWGLWQQRFGNPKGQIEALVNALRIFRNLKEFDTAQKEHYMAARFPDVWPKVLELVGDSSISLAYLRPAICS